MIIIGIDPGTQKTGYGIINVTEHGIAVIDFGCIIPPLQLKLTDRYLIIFNAIEELLEKYHPLVMAVETQFVNKNVQSAIKLGMARGIAVIAAKKQGLTVVEYSPATAKRAAVGNGRASKNQVQIMIQRLFDLHEPPPEDAADALALALCHAHAGHFDAALQAEI